MTGVHDYVQANLQNTGINHIPGDAFLE